MKHPKRSYIDLAPSALSQDEAQDTLGAIRVGEVDALVIEGSDGAAVYTLKDAHHPYRLIIERMSEGALVLGEDGTLLYCNLSFANFVGSKKTALLGRPIHDCIAPEHYARLDSVLELARSAPAAVELDLVGSQGSLPAYLSASPLDIDGGQSCISLVVTDLSLRRKSEYVAAAERFARSILDQAAEPIIVCDAQGIVTHASLAAQALCTASPLGRPYDKVFPLCSTEAHENGQDGGVAARARSIAVHMNCRGGETKHFLARESALKDAQGQTIGRIVSLTDITERERAEAELRIAAIAFESQEGMLVTDAQGIIVRVNQAFCRLTGYSPAESIGQSPALLKSGRHSEAYYQRMWQTLKDKGYWQGEMWNRRKNGRIYAEWLTISAVYSADGDITHFVGAFSDITQNKESEAEIHRLAYYDPLTHLPNRRLLHDRISQAMASSARSRHHGVLLFLDLDNFKMLNDTRGHDVGDQLLIEAARRILADVRVDDTVARLGGDEFVVMLENLSVEAPEAAIQAGNVAEKIRDSLARPYDLGGRECHCPASLGVALFRGIGESVETLLKHADLAMYMAKSAGRNTLRFFDPAMQIALDKRSVLEADLRLALKGDQFHLFYQPQIDGAHRVIGAEALLRWMHPERGLVLPGEFIPLAEETGLIVPIGQWVLAAACAQIKTWSAAPATRDLQLAVNVSSRQFGQPEFVSHVTQALAQTGADPTRLKIELTESLVINNVADTIVRMHALRALGVSFSMDDFGTGYSSLAYLKRLPLNQLKIDRSFVSDIADNPNDAAIVQTIISMGRTLGLEVIAEGVETESQLNCLAKYGCTTFQGYLYSQPVPLAAFENFVQANARI